jgi:tocopherol cyclase
MMMPLKLITRVLLQVVMMLVFFCMKKSMNVDVVVVAFTCKCYLNRSTRRMVGTGTSTTSTVITTSTLTRTGTGKEKEGVRFSISKFLNLNLNLNAHSEHTSIHTSKDNDSTVSQHTRSHSTSTCTQNRTHSHNCDDVIAYTQQTPHSGRHFLPYHPYYYKYCKDNNNTSSILPKRKASQSIKKQRFMEGWYYRLTLPDHDTSIAFMYSIEIEDQNNDKRNNYVPSLTAIQIMGPNDTYLVQADTDISKFWAYEHCQAFGCIFDTTKSNNSSTATIDATQNPAKDTESFLSQINHGYQVLPTNMQGRILGHDGSFGGVMQNQGIKGYCEFKMDIIPYSGWGDDEDKNDSYKTDCNNEDDNNVDHRHNRGKKIMWLRKLLFRRRNNNKTQITTNSNNVQSQQPPKRLKSLSKHQKSTAGWLASYSIFEPHWQITLADARATGYVNWNGTLYEFNNAPFYVEKNWGSSFPTKWYWIQCNSFIGYYNGTSTGSTGISSNSSNHKETRLSLTAGGGIRTLSFLGGRMKKTENLGMVGIHYNGTFYENVPWTGDMEWDIDTWGRWNFKGRCTSGKRLFEVEVNATCDLDSGVMLRVPTKEYGLEYMCRDTFEGTVTLSLFELEYCRQTKGYVRRPDVPPIIDNAISHNCAVEVGGPWNERWKSNSKMNKFLKFLVKLPYLIHR